jgi:hypothetical protein
MGNGHQQTDHLSGSCSCLWYAQLSLIQVVQRSRKMQCTATCEGKVPQPNLHLSALQVSSLPFWLAETGQVMYRNVHGAREPRNPDAH